MLSVIMLTVTNAECHIKAPYAECRYAECQGGKLSTMIIGSIGSPMTKLALSATYVRTTRL
jgi:hypothetical protein